MNDFISKIKENGDFQKSKTLLFLNSQLIFAPKEKYKVKKYLKKSPLKTNIFWQDSDKGCDLHGYLKPLNGLEFLKEKIK